MASNLKKVSKMSEWKPQARERAFKFAMISGPVSLFLVVVMVMLMAAMLGRLPKPVDTFAAITDVTRVQNYARNSLLLWMGGSTSAQEPLMLRSSATQSIELSTVPFEVRSIDPSDIERWQGSDAVQWRATFAVTYVAPGSSSAQINRYAVTVLDNEGNYQMLMWPSIVNIDTQPFKVATKYTDPVDSSGALAQSVDRFVSAYLASEQDSTSLGQYVSSKYVGSAIADSPYTSAEVQEIKASVGTGQTGNAKPGTTVHIMVEVKALASIQTWSIMQLALQMTLGSNNVWLVDGIDAPVGWGAISGR